MTVNQVGYLMQVKLRCVVLNATYEPLSVIPARRGFVLIQKGKATVVKYHENKFFESIDEIHKIPAVILLKKHVKRYVANAMLTRKNLFERDNYTCQYCGRAKLKDKEFLTRDHVVPESKGGKSTWTNLVTCCNTCNNKKGNTLLEDSTMKLIKIPITPSIVDIWTTRFKLELS